MWDEILSEHLTNTEPEHNEYKRYSTYRSVSAIDRMFSTDDEILWGRDREDENDDYR